MATAKVKVGLEDLRVGLEGYLAFKKQTAILLVAQEKAEVELLGVL